MPFKSKAQQRYMYAHKGEMEREGVNLSEWSSATDYSKLPERKGSLRRAASKAKKQRNG